MAIQRPKLKFQRGSTYVIDLSDASNAGHPLRFTADSGTTEYSHGVTVTGTPGQAGAKVTFNVPDSAPENLMYYCSTHGIGMGNKIKSFGPLGKWFGDRAVMYQGEYASSSNTYYSSTFSYVTIDTPSNASDFSNAAYDGGNTPSNGNMSNGTRGVYTEGSGRDDMRYITFATTSSAANFGSSYTYGNRWGAGSASNGTRGFLVGEVTSTNSNWEKISYFTIDTTGNATDFGATMNGTRVSRGFAVGNKTYIVAGAAFDSTVTPRQRSAMGRFTAMTSANASFFGNMTSAGWYVSGCSNDNRAVLAGKESEVTGSSNIFQQATETFVIDTTGNASTFGNLRRKRARGTVACNSTIGVYMGGEYDDGGTYPATSEMDYFSMVTAGNSTDFGDLTGNRARDWAAASGNAS